MVGVHVLSSSPDDPECEHGSSQTKHYATGICCFSAKVTELRSKSKDWSTRNQDELTGGLLFQ